MKLKLAAVAMTAAMACACDGQVDKGYRGEPLLTVRGSVVSSETPLDSNVVPTVIFGQRTYPDSQNENNWSTVAQFLRGDVEGSFPNAFTLTVYEPPLAELLHPLFTGEPLVAIAPIAAAPVGHPSWLRGTHTENAAGGSLVSGQVCADDGTCIASEKSCDTFPLTWPCVPQFPANVPWSAYGYAQEKLVLYLDAPAPAGSLTARYFAQGQALTAGYHLLSLRSSGEADPLCAEAQWQIAVATLRAHDPMWSSVMPATNRVVYDEAVARAELDHPCAGDVVHTVIPGGEPIELTLAAEPTSYYY